MCEQRVRTLLPLGPISPQDGTSIAAVQNSSGLVYPCGQGSIKMQVVAEWGVVTPLRVGLSGQPLRASLDCLLQCCLSLGGFKGDTHTIVKKKHPENSPKTT